MLPLATALDGMSRADMMRLTGMEPPALRDAVVRYNVEGTGWTAQLAQAKPNPALTETEQAPLSNAPSAALTVPRTVAQTGLCPCCVAGSSAASTSGCTRPTS